MSSLATKEVLEQELKRYEERYEFLDKWIASLVSSEDFDAKDKIYKMSQERDFKKNLAAQRRGQIKQINDQEELKVKASKEMPEMIKKAEKVVVKMTSDIDTAKKTQVIGKAKNEEKKVLIGGLVQQRDHLKQVFNAILENYLGDQNHKELLADFRTLNEIIKIGENK